MALTRREALAAAGAATLAAPAIARSMARPADTIVIGAGVFGAWTAQRLQAAGERVTLLDAWGPAHARASSGGESRMTRGAYGADEVYTRMARDSLADWQALSQRSGLPIFHPMGVLFFSPTFDDYFRQTIETHRRLGLPTQALDNKALRRRFPQIDFDGVEIGVWEPQFGALMARRAVQTLVAEFVAAGGTYANVAVRAPSASGNALREVRGADGSRFAARRFVFACGPWLPKLFPGLLGRRIFPTRQEIFFFAPDAGDIRFLPGRFPGWADFNGGDIYYGFPDLENRGFKIANDKHGPPMDPDKGDRIPSPAALADVRAYMARRFPALAKAPLSEARVCQYENSANGDFLIDFHPQLKNVLLIGGGSGHGFKHGPAVGRYAAALLSQPSAPVEPRFSLATKGEVQARAVH